MSKTVLNEKIELSKLQIEVINGAMLGDGCLYKHKNGINAQFIYGSKSKQHTEFVCDYFKDYWSGEGLKYCSYLDKRTNKEYSRYVVKTYTNPTFTTIYKHWYDTQGVKHLPDDLVLTPLTCLIWYIGDGGVCQSNRSEYIKLSTHCFNKDEQEKVLLPQLQQFEASLMRATDEQYYIYIPHRKEKDFLKYIGECPFTDYQYKWKVKEYKNKVPTNHANLEKIFCDMYLKGFTYYAIAKQYNIEPNVVKHYLIKNNIYKPPTQETLKYRNAVVQYKNNEVIKFYESGTQAERELGISSTGISSVCNGRRSSAGGYQWKKFKNLSTEEQEYIKQKFN